MEKQKLQSKIEVITPEIAKKYLSLSAGNRNLSPSNQRACERDISKGDWVLNGEAIKFNQSGKLVDGHHRLSAVVKTGKPIETLVVYGVADDIYIFDKGKPRSTTDTLKISKTDQALADNRIIATAKFHFQMQANISKASDEQIKQYLEKHNDSFHKLKDIIKKTRKKNFKGVGAPMFLSMYYAIELGRDYQSILRFSEILYSGFYESPSEKAAVVLRNDIINKTITCDKREDRFNACYATEKAIDDFLKGYERKATYKNCTEPIFSNNILFKAN